MEVKFVFHGTHVGIRDDGHIPPLDERISGGDRPKHVALFIDQEPPRAISDTSPVALDRRVSFFLNPDEAQSLASALSMAATNALTR